MTSTKPSIDQTKNGLCEVKRVVIKIGTRIIDNEKTHFNRPVIQSIVNDIAELRSQGIEVILVSSGAVGAGLRTLGIQGGRPASIHLRQAYAAVGQSRLMDLYSQMFANYNIITGQVLLTRSGLDRRESYLNARETLQHLMAIGVLPIVNENDTVAIEELKFSDNDLLAALVAGGINADLLILLTTVDGVYRSFDRKTGAGELIEVIDRNLDEAFALVDDRTDALSLGGMGSKLRASQIASQKGIPVVIANGLKKGIIGEIFAGRARATWILPSKKRMAARKYYLAFAKRPCGGKITVDDGAVIALREQGKSLLASGIKVVTGKFLEKDLIQIVDSQGREIARGLSSYSSERLTQIQGRSSKEIHQILGVSKAVAAVHRDNLVITG